jgi:hypothetical protein
VRLSVSGLPEKETMANLTHPNGAKVTVADEMIPKLEAYGFTTDTGEAPATKTKAPARKASSGPAKTVGDADSPFAGLN